MRLITALAPLTFLALASPAFAAGSMQLTGHGEVMAAPDTAYVNSGVSTQAETAKDALAANTTDMSKLIETLKAAGIDSKDIQTSGFSVSPNYVYPDNNTGNQPPKIVGYTVTNQVTVHVRDLTQLGSILDQSVQVGANTINGITFAVDDPSDLYAEARKAAFADAKAKAQLYAEAADVGLGDIQIISEQQNYNQPPQPVMYKATAMAADRSAPVPVEVGQLTFSIDVNVNWELGAAATN